MGMKGIDTAVATEPVVTDIRKESHGVNIVLALSKLMRYLSHSVYYSQ